MFVQCIFLNSFQQEELLFVQQHSGGVSSEFLCFRHHLFFLPITLDSFLAVKGFSIPRLDFPQTPHQTCSAEEQLCPNVCLPQIKTEIKLLFDSEKFFLPTFIFIL